MMIHLESGTCESGVQQHDIDTWAFECSQRHHYTNAWNDDHKYRCPECNSDMPKVSAMFQHVESPACGADYQGSLGKLNRFIASQVSELAG